MGRFDPSERKLPHRDETRHAQGEAPPRRSRKNTRRWCKGRRGVEHQPAIALSRHGEYWAALDRQDGGHRHECRWDRGPLAFLRPEHPTDPGWGWSCWHHEVCTVCGKVLDLFVGDRCPDYTLDLPTEATK